MSHIFKLFRTFIHNACRLFWVKNLKIRVEGNIASGKSTLLTGLQNYYPLMLIIPEPVHKWVETLNLVKNYPGQGYEYLLQNIISDDYIDAYEQFKMNKHGGITERSMDACVEVFASIYHDLGKQFINDHQLEQLKKRKHRFAIDYDVCIFVKTSVETCLERSAQRGRNCEIALKSTFLHQIEHKYDLMVANLIQKGKTIFIINGENSKESVLTETIDIIEKLKLN